MSGLSNNKRIGDIEFLRGFGMLFVVHHHLYGLLITWPNSVEPIYQKLGFNYWLDVFFVISGFVIARDLIQKIQSSNGRTTFAAVALKFWLRRIWRLLPTAWFWLFFIFVCSIWFNASGAFGSVRANFEASVAGILQFSNLRFADSWTHYEYGASFHYWSLSLEEQFYMALPFVVLLTGRWLPYFLCFLVVSQFFIERNSLEHMFIYMVRTDGFALGVLIAMWSGRPTYQWLEPKFLHNKRWLQLMIAILLVFVLSVVDSPKLQTVFFNKGIVALLCGFVVFLTSYNRDYLWADGPFKRFFVWLGARSYTIYVVHVPVYCLTRELWFRFSPAGTVFDASYTLCFVLTAFFLLAILVELNFRFIESPLRNRGLQISSDIFKRYGAVA